MSVRDPAGPHVIDVPTAEAGSAAQLFRVEIR